MSTRSGCAPPSCRVPPGGRPADRSGRAWLRAPVLALGAAAALASACARTDSITATTYDIGGAYTLRAVGQDTLPATVYDSTFALSGLRVTIAITGGTMTLSHAGGYIFDLTYTFLVNGYPQPTTPLGDRGVWERTGTTLTFTSVDGQGTMSGTLAGTDLTMAQDLLDDGAPLSLVYRK